jgi:hypothetical protein
MVERMPGSIYHQVTHQRHAQKRKIPEAIKYLVSDKLIRITQAVFI